MIKQLDKWYCYSGAVHIHTTESDGTKPIEEVIRIGQRADLDFMMFADHMNLNNRDNQKEGIFGKTLVVIGYEHNDLNDEHHFLVFDSSRVYGENLKASEYVTACASDNALGILAHPDEIRDTLAEHPPYPWRDWSNDNFTGLELWNQMSEWMEKLTKYNKLLMSFSPRKSMSGPTDRILCKWDELNLKRKYVGIASVDAHAFPIKVGPMTVEIFPYKVHFRSLRTHILLPEKMSDNFEIAKKQLYDALRDCRVFISNMRWGTADKFEFYIKKDAELAVSGGNISSSDDATLYVKLPEEADVNIIHNGNRILQTKSDYIELKGLKKGLYRVEAYKGKRGWIFSNHIRIGMES